MNNQNYVNIELSSEEIECIKDSLKDDIWAAKSLRCVRPSPVGNSPVEFLNFLESMYDRVEDSSRLTKDEIKYITSSLSQSLATYIEDSFDLLDDDEDYDIPELVESLKIEYSSIINRLKHHMLNTGPYHAQ